MELVSQLNNIYLMDSLEDIKSLDYDLLNLLLLHGKDIIDHPRFNESKQYIQHGKISVYVHSISVAYISLLLARKLNLDIDIPSLVRGALLHDYFLYDWHLDKDHGLHGFTHASTAYKNASRDFELNEIEADIIKKHMFPLNIKAPKYKESMLVCLSDKISASIETVYFRGHYYD